MVSNRALIIGCAVFASLMIFASVYAGGDEAAFIQEKIDADSALWHEKASDYNAELAEVQKYKNLAQSHQTAADQIKAEMDALSTLNDTRRAQLKSFPQEQ